MAKLSRVKTFMVTRQNLRSLEKLRVLPVVPLEPPFTQKHMAVKLLQKAKKAQKVRKFSPSKVLHILFYKLFGKPS